MLPAIKWAGPFCWLNSLTGSASHNARHMVGPRRNICSMMDLSLFPNPACLWLRLLRYVSASRWLGSRVLFCDLLRVDTPYSTQMRPPLRSRRRMHTNANLQKVPFSHRCQIKFPANPFREGQCSFSSKCGLLNSMEEPAFGNPI